MDYVPILASLWFRWHLPIFRLQFNFFWPILHYASWFIGTRYFYHFFFKARKQINKWQNLYKKMIYYETKLSSWKTRNLTFFVQKLYCKKLNLSLTRFSSQHFQESFFFQYLWFISHNRRWLIMVVSREITNTNKDSQNTPLSALINESSFS